MYKPICHARNQPILSALIAAMSTFFQVFIELGMYNFGHHDDLQNFPTN